MSVISLKVSLLLFAELLKNPARYFKELEQVAAARIHGSRT